MTDRKLLYTAVSRAAWGYFFLYFDINLGAVDILPSFVGWLLFLSAIKLLTAERRDLALLRPLGILLTVWSVIAWLAAAVGLTLGRIFGILDLVVGVAALYFHFQLMTDFAALAVQYQPAGEELDKRLLKWRTRQTVLQTAVMLMTYPAEWLPEWWAYVILALAVISLIAGLCLMAALFSLRKLFRERPLG